MAFSIESLVLGQNWLKEVKIGDILKASNDFSIIETSVKSIEPVKMTAVEIKTSLSKIICSKDQLLCLANKSIKSVDKLNLNDSLLFFTGCKNETYKFVADMIISLENLEEKEMINIEIDAKMVFVNGGIICYL